MSETNEPSPTLTATPSTQARMLEAGIDLWANEDPSTVFGGFSVARVAKAAGVTRATFYSYWPTTQDYLLALVAHLDNRPEGGWSSEVASRVDLLRMAGTRALDSFLETSVLRLAQNLEDPAVRVRLGFASKADDPDIADGLRSLYRNMEERTFGPNRALRDSWGREPRLPFTEGRIQALFSALLDGITIRRMIDPDMMPIESFGIAGAIIMSITTRAIDDPRDTFDLLSAMNQWPSIGVRLAAERRSLEAMESPALDIEIVRVATVAARRMLSHVNWHEITIDEIAVAIGIGSERLLRTFGSKTGLALAIIALNSDERWQETPRTGDPLADLSTLLDIILEELRRTPSLGQSTIHFLSGGTRLPDDVILTSAPVPDIARLLADARAAGQIIPEIDPAAFSISLTRIMLAEGVPVTISGTAQVNSLRYILEGIRIRE